MEHRNFGQQLAAATSKKHFGKYTDGSSSKSRLEDLLRRVENYTRFLLDQNKRHRDKTAQEKMREAEAALLEESPSQAVAGPTGKESVSKRRTKSFKENIEKTGMRVAENDDNDEDQNLLTRLNEQPTILKGGQLRDYQMDGLNWMISLYETGINGILADEMGLGKTIQTISFVSFLREFKKVNGYHLILMPKSVVGNWMAEFRRWSPEIKVINLIARKESREEIIKNELAPGNFDVCITTFEGVRICMSALSKFNWHYIIIDEAHKIKNEDSQTSKRIKSLRSKQRLLLTGTPLQNKLHELWSLLNFLLPEVFSSSEDFDEWFDLKASDNLTEAEIEEKNSQVIKQLHKILRPFMLRRVKREVEKSLLPKIEMHINVGITETQKSIYRQLLKKSTIDKGTSASHYKNILVQLRKVCDHPYLFPGVEPEDAPVLGDHLINVSGKMRFLDKLLKKCKADNSQTLIFSGFTTMLDILEDYCIHRDYKYCRLDGNTDLDYRQEQIDDFTSPDTDKFIFLISTRAGGLGLNLMTANTVVLYDSDWNPQMDLQAMDRAHRIGQKKQVRVYRLITDQTMEKKMVEKQAMKLKLDSMIIQKGRVAPKNTGYQKDDYRDMVNYGADAIFEIGSDMDEMDLDKMIEEGEARAKTLNDQTEEIMKEKFNMLNFEMNPCNLYEFEDIDYLKEKRKDQEDLIKSKVIAMLDAETAEYTRKKVRKNLADSSLAPKIYDNGNIGVSNEAKKKRLAKVTDFRFYPDPDRLRELIIIEMEARYSGYIQGKETIQFTPEMQIEKDLIESKGFPDWDRREFQKFVQALETFSTKDYVSISKYMDGTKTPEQVEAYATVFFEKAHTLNNGTKTLQKIEKAQKHVSFNMRAPSVIRQKIEQNAGVPLEEMNLQHATQKSKFFTKESDALLLTLTDELGFGNWSEIRKRIRRETRYRFDHLFMSRSEDEIKKRVIYLVQSIEKENETMPSCDQSMVAADKKPDIAMLQAEIEQRIKEAEAKMDRELQIIKEQKEAALAAAEAAPAPSKSVSGFDKTSPRASQRSQSIVIKSVTNDKKEITTTPIHEQSDDEEMSSMHNVPEANSSDEDDEMKEEEALHEYDMSEAQQKAHVKVQNKKSKAKKKSRTKQREDEVDDGDNSSGIRLGDCGSASEGNDDVVDDDNQDEWPESNMSSHDKNVKMSDEQTEQEKPAAKVNGGSKHSKAPVTPSKNGHAQLNGGKTSISVKGKQAKLSDMFGKEPKNGVPEQSTPMKAKNLVGHKRAARGLNNDRADLVTSTEKRRRFGEL